MPSPAPTPSGTQLWTWKYESVIESVVVPGDVTAIYSEVRFADEIIIGGCTDYGVFVNSELPVLTNALLVKSVELFVVNDLLDNATVAGCSETAVAREMVSKAGKFESNSYTCSGNSWEAKACTVNNTRFGALCANCTVADMCDRADAGECAEDYSFNPCSTSSNCTTGMIRIFVITFLPPEPAPIIDSIVVSQGDANTKLDVAVVLEGLVINAKDLYCAAFLATKAAIKSTADITFYNFHHGSFVNAANSTNIVITGLTPFTNYSVSCYTVSRDVVETSISTVLSQTVYGKTACCKSLIIDLNVNSIFAGASKQKGLTITLESAPETPVIIQLGAMDSFGVAIANSPFFPSTVTVNPTSLLVVEVAFTGLPTMGSYDLNISFSGDDGFALTYARSSTLTILPLDGGISPPAPTLESVVFSSSGTSLSVTLDSASDSFGTVAGTMFSCSELFIFEGVERATCQFTDPSVVAVYLVAGTLEVGNNFTLLANKTHAECASPSTAAQCLGWDLNMAAVVVVQKPLVPLQPVISISGPATIGSCDSLSLDLSGSTGGGGRKWTSIGVVVTATSTTPTNDLNTSAIFDHLMFVFATGSRNPIPREILVGGNTYTFVIELCNFLGECSSNSYIVSVFTIDN